MQPLGTVVVAPLSKDGASAAIEKLLPVVNVKGVRYRAIMATLAAVPRTRLGKTVANAGAQHSEFVAAIELLFTGI